MPHVFGNRGRHAGLRIETPRGKALASQGSFGRMGRSEGLPTEEVGVVGGAAEPCVQSGQVGPILFAEDDRPPT